MRRVAGRGRHRNRPLPGRRPARHRSYRQSVWICTDVVGSDAAAEVFGKRILVEISHTIERFALSAPADEPLVVVAMFQKLSYFEREAAVYEEIAARGALVIVGLAEDIPPRLAPGVRHALIAASDPLAREWSVTVLGPRGGATLVAIDLESVGADGDSLEAARLFRGRWSFRRAEAYREIYRLRAELPLLEQLGRRIDEHLHRVHAEPEPAEQDWREVPLRFTTDRIDQVLRERTELTRARDDVHERDPRSGLYNGRFLARWVDGLGDGTLPVGLALLRIHGIPEVRSRYGLRAELAALRAVARTLQHRLDEGDRAVRLGPQDFLVVLPSRTPDEVRALADRMCHDLAGLDRSYPFVSLPATVTSTVTRHRPLPLDRLRDELDGAAPEDAAALVR